MFTGIVRNLGTIHKIRHSNQITTIEIECPEIVKSKMTGDSISVDGVCLTIMEMTFHGFKTQVMTETIEKTIISSYKKDQKVNLETPLVLGGTLDGHFVSGHIDFTGTVKKIEHIGDARDMEITFPETMGKYFALKGSVCVNGVSLTISRLDKQSFTVSLIPETLNKTNIGHLKEQSMVNIEIDLLSRYIEALLQEKEKNADYEFLNERGFL